jgi:hypothetical protein
VETEITPIAFSEEIKARAKEITRSYMSHQLLSSNVRIIAIAIEQSGFFLEMQKDLDKVLGGSVESQKYDALKVEQENQENLLAAGITDDATADQWLTQIESKLLTVRSEYQKVSDRHKQELEEFCKQWRV